MYCSHSNNAYKGPAGPRGSFLSLGLQRCLRVSRTKFNRTHVDCNNDIHIEGDSTYRTPDRGQFISFDPKDPDGDFDYESPDSEQDHDSDSSSKSDTSFIVGRIYTRIDS